MTMIPTIMSNKNPIFVNLYEVPCERPGSPFWCSRCVEKFRRPLNELKRVSSVCDVLMAETVPIE